MLSTHEQMLGGDDGMVYLGCEFPARDEYRKLLLDYSMKIGEILASKGCRDRFAIDYVVREVNG